jgi:hypothetical protein
MIVGKPKRFAPTAALLLLVAANALAASGNLVFGAQPGIRRTLQVALQSSHQRTLSSRATPETVVQSSHQHNQFTAPAVRPHWPAAQFSAWLQLSRTAARSLASGVEFTSGRAPPTVL